MKCAVFCVFLSGASYAQSAGDMEAIQDSLSRISDSAVLAYEELLADSALVMGTIMVTFTVSRDGFVGDVVAECDESLEPVARVIREAVAALRFGPLSRGDTPLEISVPFDFVPITE